MIANFCRLALDFDAALLRSDLAHLDARDWESHFNADYHDGGWFGVALRGVAGSAVKLYPEPVSGARYVDLPILARLPHLRHALLRFACPLQSVRLLRLAAGTSIHEHSDYGLGFVEGTVRLHLPLVTGPEVEFYVDNRRVVMDEGECWYLDLSLPHRVQNHGRTDRVHLVMDCTVNDWLLSLFPGDSEIAAQHRAPRMIAGAASSSQRQLESFQRMVIADPGLQERFRNESERDRFIALVVETGREKGFRFTATDVDAAIKANRRAWIERMLVQ
jgi:mannose-6-phosphate isomerase-like protein (cupin superfamily)